MDLMNFKKFIKILQFNKISIAADYTYAKLRN